MSAPNCKNPQEYLEEAARTVIGLTDLICACGWKPSGGNVPEVSNSRAPDELHNENCVVGLAQRGLGLERTLRHSTSRTARKRKVSRRRTSAHG